MAAVYSKRQRTVYAFEQSCASNSGALRDEDAEDLMRSEQEEKAPGDELADFLMHLKYSGKLSAKDVCVVARWARDAGAQGRVTEMALNPDSQTGKFQAKLDRVLKVGKELGDDAYTLHVPGYDRYELSRTTLQIPALPPHETLTREWEHESQNVNELREQLENNEWGKVYHAHPVVRAAPADTVVVPLALYLDKGQYKKRDSVTIFTVYSLVSNIRHLVLTVRTSDACQCGCLRWCTYHEVFRFLSWSLAALATGQNPSARHDGKPFDVDTERTRYEEAGMPCMRGAVVYVKGDWQEFASTLGLPNWSSVTHPCFCCWALRDELYTIGRLSLVESPYERKTAEQYNDACSNCERLVWVDCAETHAAILQLLRYDKRRKGSRGRALQGNLPNLGLMAGDRLEPSDVLPDIGAFEGLVGRLPVQVTFWRPVNNTLALHRNQVFGANTGISIQNIAIDVLHTLHLGVFKQYCMDAIWSLIEANAWDVTPQAPTVQDQLSVGRCRVELLDWYKRKRRDDPNIRLYELSDLTANMLGTRNDRQLATKAAETGSLLGFCHETCATYIAKLGERGPFLTSLGAVLQKMFDIMRTNPRVLGPSTAQEFVDCIKRAYVLAPEAGVSFIPKFHLMLHLGHLCEEMGNPYYFQTFLDEGYNGRLCKLAATCHRMTFYKRVLAGFRLAHERDAPRRAR